jgi:hypothetical protein
VVVNPPEGEIDDIRVGRERAVASASPIPADDPLLASVNLSELKLDRVRPLTLGPGARPLMRLGGDVIAATVESLSGRTIVLGFDVTRAGWQLKPSFVVFWADVLKELESRSGAGGLSFYHAGDVVRVPVGKEPVTVKGPGGEVRLSRADAGWGSFLADRVGLYRYTAGGRERVVAVNLLSEMESDNRPVATPAPNLTIPAAPGGKVFPLGPWLCLVAGILAATWWVVRR